MTKGRVCRRKQTPLMQHLDYDAGLRNPPRGSTLNWAQKPTTLDCVGTRYAWRDIIHVKPHCGWHEEVHG
jgi:hypothetical protein